MDNLLTYIKFRRDIPFKISPFNEVDAMAFAFLTGLDFDGLFNDKCDLKTAFLLYKEKGIRDEKDDRSFEKENVLELMADSVRYKDVMIADYVKEISEEEQKTFYAMTFYTSRHDAYVAYRGTDGTLLSWRENFNCIYQMPSSGQYSSLKYLSKVCEKPFMRVNVLGHSKGGNLALFAAMSLDEKLQRKIKNVYVFDGPGFVDNIDEKLGFQRIRDKVKAFVPVSCVIGNLMKTPYEKTVVNGEGEGLFQHDLYCWMVDNEGIVKTDAVNEYGNNLSSKVNNWIDSMDINDREKVVDELFSVFSKNGINHISDLTHMDLKHVLNILRCLTSLSTENRELLSIVIKQLKNHH